MTKNKLNLRIWPRLKIGQDFTLQPKSEAELKQRKEDGMRISLSGIKRRIHFICLVFILQKKKCFIPCDNNPLLLMGGTHCFEKIDYMQGDFFNRPP